MVTGGDIIIKLNTPPPSPAMFPPIHLFHYHFSSLSSHIWEVMEGATEEVNENQLTGEKQQKNPS